MVPGSQEWGRSGQQAGRGAPRRTGLVATLVVGTAACLAVWVLHRPLAASPQRDALAGNPIGSVFFIAKSENRNQVHYAVLVDGHCRPRGERPVYGYWRDYEDGPDVTSPLLDREQSAYGLTAPRSIRRAQAGGRVQIGLRGFPDRPLTIETFRVQDRCRARALTTIAGSPAVLRSIYVELGFLFSIDYVLIRGYRVSDSRPVQEKVDD